MARTKIGNAHDGTHNAFAKRGERSHDTFFNSNVARAHDRGVPGNIARDGAPKRLHPTPLHNGMSKITKSGAVSFGGDHASALDSLSGQVVVPGAVKTAPGWGNAGARSGHPLTKPPAAKNLQPVATTPGMRSRTKPHDPNLGQAMLQAAFDCAAPDDRMAHGRK